MVKGQLAGTAQVSWHQLSLAEAEMETHEASTLGVAGFGWAGYSGAGAATGAAPAATGAAPAAATAGAGEAFAASSPHAHMVLGQVSGLTHEVWHQ